MTNEIIDHINRAIELVENSMYDITRKDFITILSEIKEKLEVIEDE